MKNLHPIIAREYERWRYAVGDAEPYTGENILGIHDVLRAHFLIADSFATRDDPVGLIGPRDLGLLHSALSRQVVSFGGIDKWERGTEVIATLFYGLIKNHPFSDGNKRTALLSALYHMAKCSLTPAVGQSEIERITLAVAENSLEQYPRFRDYSKKGKADAAVLFLAHWFRNATRQVDKRFYTITYNDLQTILNRYGFYLENPRHNHIDVIRYKDAIVFSPLPKRQQKKVKIAQIGLPSWKAQVGQGAINTVRKATGLTAEKGFDSQTFFYGLDDMKTLIDIYSGPLTRLKDK